jgi:chitosanase
MMKQAQDEFFDTFYYQRAYQWFEEEGFTLPLSLLVIYDSFVHSGNILPLLRRKFPEMTPKNGGDEKVWITQYTATRHQWLSTHSRPILRKTIYRTFGYQLQIGLDNWDLSERVKMNGEVSRSI